MDPVVAGVQLSADGASTAITLSGIGSRGIIATIGALGFEVLGRCNCTGGPCFYWVSTPIAAATKTTVTVTALPANPQAFRFLWYIAPYAVDNKLVPFKAPIGTYALADLNPGDRSGPWRRWHARASQPIHPTDVTIALPPFYTGLRPVLGDLS